MSLRGNVLIIEGNKNLSKNFILSLIDSSNIYKSLYNSGYFEDVKIKRSDDSIFIHLKEYPLIKHISLNKDLIYPSVVNKILPFENNVLNKNALKDTLLSIINYYIYNGYPEVVFDTVSVQDSILYLHLYQGEVDSIRFFGTREKDEFIKKLININDGDIIDNYKIQYSLSNVLHSGYFYDAKYCITKKKIYYLDFYLLDAFPLIDTTSIYLSHSGLIEQNIGKYLSVTNRFDDIHYKVANYIYFNHNFSIDRWFFNSFVTYTPFRSGINFDVTDLFNYNYSLHGLILGYNNNYLNINAGSGYDFIKNNCSLIGYIKVNYHNLIYNSRIFWNLKSYLYYNNLSFKLDFARNWTFKIFSDYNLSDSPVFTPVPIAGFRYVKSTRSYLFCSALEYTDFLNSAKYSIAYFNGDLYEAIEFGYKGISLFVSSRLTSGIEEHFGFSYRSVIPF